MNWKSLFSLGFGNTSAECSKEAFEHIKVASLQMLVEERYLKCGKYGLTADEATNQLRVLGVKVDKGSIRPRVTELKMEGILENTGDKRKNAEGKNCAVLVHFDYAYGSKR